MSVAPEPDVPRRRRLEALPDVSGLASVDAGTWREFGRRLAAIGFGPAFCAAMWRAPQHLYPGLHWPVHEWRVQTMEGPAATVYRLFCLGHVIPEADGVAALTGPVVAASLDAGLLDRVDGRSVASVLELRAHQDLFVFCDDLGLKGDAVFGGGLGNQAFSGIVSASWPAETAVDIGCGGGTAAMAMARDVDRVVATDINPRAIAVARVNAEINGVTNIEFRHGDLFEPVKGETFDVVIAQPPFVPQPPDVAGATYQLGGRLGLDLVERVVAGTPAHLSTRGRAAIVYEAPVTFDGGDVDSWCSRLAEPGVRGLRLLGSGVEADAYSVRYAVPSLRRGVSLFDAAVAAMRSHLDSVGIARVRPALAVLERSDDRSSWLETVNVEGNLWDGIGEWSLRRLLGGFAAIGRGEEALLDGPLRVPAGSLVIEPFADAGDVSGEAILVLPYGCPGERQAWTRKELEVLARCLGTDRRDRSTAPELLELAVRRKALRAGLLA